MYEKFYGLSELPFELTANPKFLFLSAGQREALSMLRVRAVFGEGADAPYWRSRDRKDHADPGGARVGAMPQCALRLPE